MRRLWHELRLAVSALVLLGLAARLLAPLPALAAFERSAFDAALHAALCLPSGLPTPDQPDQAPEAATAGHCPLCRLPDALDAPVPAPVVALPGPCWAGPVRHHPLTADAAPRLSPHGPPPARAPPVSPTIG